MKLESFRAFSPLRLSRSLTTALFALLSFASGLAGERSFTLTFRSGTKSSDSQVAMPANVAKTIESGAEHLKLITDVSRVYLARSGYGWRFSSSSTIGSVTLHLAEAITPSRMVISAAAFAEEALLSVNGVSCTIAAGDTEFADRTFSGFPPEPVSAIKLSSRSRSYMRSMTIYYNDSEAAVPVIEADASSPRYFTMQGFPAEHPVSGNIYIEILPDGSSRKVLFR